MIMTEMTWPTTAIAERYVAVWNEPDAAARRTAVTELWAPDATEFVDGGTRHRGHGELTARVAEAYEAFVASGRFTATGADDVTAHGDIVTLTVQLTVQPLEA
jgi:ketosteroid isomerase-like protein